MSNRKPYPKRATDYNTQINILRGRGITIKDEDKAIECLSDIGYYRLGFYSYPFEMTYPKLNNSRLHDVKPGTSLEDIVAFYYYDFDLRNILNRYLSRIEVDIRTTIIKELSNKYKNNPFWYVDPKIVGNHFITKFTSEYYPKIRENDPIKRHHKKYSDQYAPAWKTMEYMTLGNLEHLYSSLLSTNDRSMISQKFNEPSFKTFRNYLSVIRHVRNACAHGSVITLMTLPDNVESGAACPSIRENDQNTFCGALKVISFLMKNVSVKRANEMWNDLYRATLNLYMKVPSLHDLVESKTGIILPPDYSYPK